MSGAPSRRRRRAWHWVLLLGAIGAWSAAAADDDDVMQEGKRLFLTGATPACALCHTLADAGSAGAIGPVLDELKPDAARVEKAVHQGLGVMPANKNLSDAQIKLLAQYVARASGAAN